MIRGFSKFLSQNCSCNLTDTLVSTPAGVFEEVFSGQSCEFLETLPPFFFFFIIFINKYVTQLTKALKPLQHIYQQAKQPKYVTKQIKNDKNCA